MATLGPGSESAIISLRLVVTLTSEFGLNRVVLKVLN